MRTASVTLDGSIEPVITAKALTADGALRQASHMIDRRLRGSGPPAMAITLIPAKDNAIEVTAIYEGQVIHNSATKHVGLGEVMRRLSCDWIEQRIADGQAPPVCEHAKQRAKLAADNVTAPADTVIRAIFEHFTYIRDDEDGHTFETAEECIDHWYNLDELRLVFDNKGTEHVEGRCDHWVYLIHQYHCAKPSVEDITDYTTGLEKTALAPMLKEEYYNGVYCL